MNTDLIIYGLVFSILFVLFIIAIYNKTHQGFQVNTINNKIKETFDDVNLEKKRDMYNDELRNAVNEITVQQEKEEKDRKKLEMNTTKTNHTSVKVNNNIDNVFDDYKGIKPITSNSDSKYDTKTNLGSMLTQLNNIETVCKEQTEQQKIIEQDESNRLDKERLLQLDLEDEKIRELEDLVKHYRQLYYQKNAVTNKCRSELKENIDKQYNFIKDNSSDFKNKTLTVKVNAPDDIKEGLKKLGKTEKHVNTYSSNNDNDNPNEIDLEDEKYKTDRCDTDVLKRDIDKINDSFDGYN
jgi:hypothetical protein